MATVKLEDVITFIETKLKTLTKLDKVEYQGADDPDPQIKQFGAIIYLGEEEFVTRENRHIGPHLTEFWTINVDIITKSKPSDPRKTISSAFGSSYWYDQLTALFLNKTNNGLFVRTSIASQEAEEINSGIKLKHLITCEILNKYT